MSRSPTRLGRPAFGWMISGSPPASTRSSRRMSWSTLGPTEQFAPAASMGSSRRARITSAGVRPRKVTPSSVKARVAITGRSLTARTPPRPGGPRRDRTWSPPRSHRRRPRAVPRPARGRRRAPRPARSRRAAQVLAEGADRAQHEDVSPHALADVPGHFTPRRLISRTWPSSPCTPSLKRFAPKVLVWTKSAPAWMYSAWMDWTSLGCSG